MPIYPLRHSPQVQGVNAQAPRFKLKQGFGTEQLTAFNMLVAEAIVLDICAILLLIRASDNDLIDKALTSAKLALDGFTVTSVVTDAEQPSASNTVHSQITE